MSTMWLPVAQEQRVDVLGELGTKTREVWIALHGYGQLVAYFQRHFRTCVTEQRAFVFPQGQHKFYLNGVSGRVGASWMTKDEREKDIENQRRYLSEVMRFVRKQCPNARFHLVGFSQGVATGMRFLGYSPEAFTSVLAWAIYEGIMADIFDHLYAATRHFDLALFQKPTGADVREIGA